MRREVVPAAPVLIVLFGVAFWRILPGEQEDVERSHSTKVVAFVLRSYQLIEIWNRRRLRDRVVQVSLRFHNLEGVERWMFQHSRICGLGPLLSEHGSHEIQAEGVWHQQRLL